MLLSIDRQKPFIKKHERPLEESKYLGQEKKASPLHSSSGQYLNIVQHENLVIWIGSTKQKYSGYYYYFKLQLCYHHQRQRAFELLWRVREKRELGREAWKSEAPFSSCKEYDDSKKMGILAVAIQKANRQDTVVIAADLEVVLKL